MIEMMLRAYGLVYRRGVVVCLDPYAKKFHVFIRNISLIILNIRCEPEGRIIFFINYSGDIMENIFRFDDKLYELFIEIYRKMLMRK